MSLGIYKKSSFGMFEDYSMVKSINLQRKMINMLKEL
jgi:hypothetical protein